MLLPCEGPANVAVVDSAGAAAPATSSLDARGPATLAAWQREVQRLLLDAPRVSDTSVAASRLVQARGRRTAEDGVHIYRQMIATRFEEVLARAYPAVRAVLTPEGFGDLCRCYLRERPSRSFTLAHLGRELADFLQAEAHPDWLVELARLEWAWEEVGDCPPRSQAVENFADRSDEDWARARFVVADDVRVLSVAHAVDVLRTELLAGTALTESKPQPSGRCEASRPATIVVHRDGTRCRTHRMTGGEEAMFLALVAGVSLGQALEDTLDRSPSPEPEHIFAWVRQWFCGGFLRTDAAVTPRG
jgi:hypothetical protein